MSDAPTMTRRETDTGAGEYIQKKSEDTAAPKGAAVPVPKPKPKREEEDGKRSAEVATGEVDDDAAPKLFKWRGLELTLPKVLPLTAAMDWGQLEEGRYQIAPVCKLLNSILGRDQYEQVYDKIQEDQVSVDEPEVLVGLVEDLLASFDTEPGESSASDDS